MPIKSTHHNTEFFAKSMFHTGDTPLDENDRDKSQDYILKEVIRPEKPHQLDFETFEYLVEKMIEREKLLNKEYDGILGDGLINFTSEVKEIEYILFDILFPEWFIEQIQEFADKGYVEYWKEGYWEEKYGEDETHFIKKKEDHEHSIKVNTIKGLYDYLYNTYAE